MKLSFAILNKFKKLIQGEYLNFYFNSKDRPVRYSRPVFLNRRAAARYRALASIIPGRERFCWNW